MCGIVGILSTEGLIGSLIRQKLFKQALYADALRGFDSTGIFCAGTANHESAHYKRALAASDFLDKNSTSRLIERSHEFAFTIGHNRWATRGGITDNTSHPFDFDNVVGVHNGTLTTTYELNNTANSLVDSQILYNTFDLKGHQDTIPKLDGAFALVWFDKKTNNLHLVRNEERPLYIAGIEGEDTIFISSEVGMLQWILGRNGIKTDFVKDIGVGKLLTFNTEKVKEYKEESVKIKVPVDYGYGNGYSLPFKKRGPTPQEDKLKALGYEKGELVSFHVTKISPYKGSDRGRIEGFLEDDPTIDININGVLVKSHKKHVGKYLIGRVVAAGMRGGSGNDLLILADDVAVPPIPSKITKTPTPKKGGPLYLGKGGTILSQKEWDEKTKHGCAMCTCNIEDSDDLTISWTEGDQPICEDCTEASEITIN